VDVRAAVIQEGVGHMSRTFERPHPHCASGRRKPDFRQPEGAVMRNESYRLATYAGSYGAARAGIVVDHEIVDVEQGLLAVGLDRAGALTSGALTSVMSILEHWEAARPDTPAARSRCPCSVVSIRSPLSSVKLLPPLMYPGTIFCAGANYKDHVAEMSRALSLPVEPDPHELGLKPWHFIKPSAPCVRATGSTISLPRYSRRVDWEAEIGLVIGRYCRDVSVSEALACVAGLTIVNDLSARDT